MGGRCAPRHTRGRRGPASCRSRPRTRQQYDLVHSRSSRRAATAAALACWRACRGDVRVLARSQSEAPRQRPHLGPPSPGTPARVATAAAAGDEHAPLASTTARPWEGRHSARVSRAATARPRLTRKLGAPGAGVPAAGKPRPPPRPRAGAAPARAARASL